MTNPLRYIVIEGPIGVGKTTLAQRVANAMGGHTLFENPDENPFLERFYHDPKHHALPAQLFFLFQRARQMDGLRQQDMFAPVTVSDFLIEKDPLFARLNLTDDELHLYEQVYKHASVSAPKPDLVIHLQAPVDVLLERVRKRSRQAESLLSREYLVRVVDAYTRFFHYYDDAPLLTINAGHVDWINNDQHFSELLTRIQSTRSGRHFFNPVTPT
jgi:deoxyadenosine/deoxycytidine kinase